VKENFSLNKKRREEAKKKKREEKMRKRLSGREGNTNPNPSPEKPTSF
jgi:hypothetical protein